MVEQHRNGERRNKVRETEQQTKTTKAGTGRQKGEKDDAPVVSET